MGNGERGNQMPLIAFQFPTPHSLLPTSHRVESRSVLPYSNSAFEAGPIHFFPNALRRSFDAPNSS